MQHLFLQQLDAEDENCAIRQHVQVYLSSASSAKVISARAKLPWALKLLPMITTANKIVARTNHPNALPVVVTMIVGNKVAAGGNGGGDGNKPAGSGKLATKSDPIDAYSDGVFRRR